VTRAKSGLIVIGDSQTLQYDRHWNAFVDWCRQEGCYITQSLSAKVVQKLYSKDVELPPRRIDPPRYDNRGTREDRLKSGGPEKVWRPVRSMPAEEEGSNTMQESAVEGMQK
jgi:hypothetical protein